MRLWERSDGQRAGGRSLSCPNAGVRRRGSDALGQRRGTARSSRLSTRIGGPRWARSAADRAPTGCSPSSPARRSSRSSPRARSRLGRCTRATFVSAFGRSAALLSAVGTSESAEGRDGRGLHRRWGAHQRDGKRSSNPTSAPPYRGASRPVSSRAAERGPAASRRGRPRSVPSRRQAGASRSHARGRCGRVRRAATPAGRRPRPSLSAAGS